jgi:hypothetical protein
LPEAATAPPRTAGSLAGIRVFGLSRILTSFTCIWAEVIEVERRLGARRAEAAS